MQVLDNRQIDENTPGSIAHQEAVRLLKGWLAALYFADVLICVFGALGKSRSLPYAFWLLLESLFFSYVVGIIVLAVAVRFFRKLLGIRKISLLDTLRTCVILSVVAVIVGSVLVYRLKPAVHVHCEFVGRNIEC